jgi:hypothetical protein
VRVPEAIVKMLVRKHAAIACLCLAVASGGAACGSSSEAEGGERSEAEVAECERKLEALDKTAEILEEKGEIPSGERPPSDVLEERWGSC